jgi:hypothetical protein
VGFCQVAAVSGASALFAYEPGEFMPKYAHLEVEPHRRIAEATGFGYEWVPFSGPEGAWARIVESIDAGHPVKGWDWEGILFAGYADAGEPAGRRIYAMADGPETYARWLTWDAFVEWADRVGHWKADEFGRHTTRVKALPARQIALRVMSDLVAWSTEPPAAVRARYPNAAFGLAGIATYADALESASLDEDWITCHDINGQWGVRNASSVYLNRVADAGLFGEEVNGHLRAAAASYRAAYGAWQRVYRDCLGHGVPAERRKSADVRRSAGDLIRAAQDDEREALSRVAQALALAQ